MTQSKRLHATALSVVSLLIASNVNIRSTNAFQVPADPNTAYKSAIEKATNQPIIISNLPVDDDTYKCQVPCPFSQSPSGTALPAVSDLDITSIKSLPGGSNIGLSDSLRTRSFLRQTIDRPPVALPLSQSGVTAKVIPPRRSGTARTVIGLDNGPAEYWFDNRIHIFGNTGLWGGVHALMAPLATRLIDDAAYKGIDARDIVSSMRGYE